MEIPTVWVVGVIFFYTWRSQIDSLSGGEGHRDEVEPADYRPKRASTEVNIE